MDWIRATFLEAEMWANRSKPTQVIVNLVNKWFWHVSRWIYIQQPASIFNLSSSSSNAAGTTSRLLLLAALLSTLRYEALLHRWPCHPSTPPHLLFFREGSNFLHNSVASWCLRKAGYLFTLWTWKLWTGKKTVSCSGVDQPYHIPLTQELSVYCKQD